MKREKNEQLHGKPFQLDGASWWSRVGGFVRQDEIVERLWGKDKFSRCREHSCRPNGPVGPQR